MSKLCRLGIHSWPKKIDIETEYSGWCCYLRYFFRCRKCGKKRYVVKAAK